MIDGDNLWNKLLWVIGVDLFKPRVDFLGECYIGVNWYESIFGVLRAWLIEPFMGLFIYMR